MKSSRLIFGRLVVLWLTVLLAVSGCGPSAPPPPTIVPASRASTPEKLVPIAASRPAIPSDFIGSEQCAECHAEIARTYASTTMGRSAAAMQQAHVIENYDQPAVNAAAGFQYLASQSPAGPVHHEILKDADGSILYDQSVPVALEIGSGQRGRSYLIARDDQLMMSPLTWYTGAAKWDLSPGYFERNLHFERRIVAGCLECHVGRVAPANSPLPDRVARPAFLEAAIGCERCHGPGGRHAELHRQARTASVAAPRGEDPIVNPAHLSADRRESVCNQCHLLGVERVLRQGRSERDFRPGDKLSDIWVIFNRQGGRGTDATSTDAVSQVHQMQSSRCYQASEGALGCVSCHDPHRQPDASERLEFFNGRCVKCHAVDSTCSAPLTDRMAVEPANSCVNCHMPKLSTKDVPHTSQTDHRVLRRPAQTPAAPTDESLTLLPGMQEQAPAQEISRARGLLMSRFARDLRDIPLAGLASSILEPLTQTEADSEIWRALGDALHVQNLPDRAEQAWGRAVELNPADEESLKNLGILFHEAGRDEEAAELFGRYLQSNRWDRAIAGRQVHVLGRLQRLEAATRWAEESVERFPWDYRLREWLAQSYRIRGDNPAADRHQRIADRLKPAP